MLTLGYHAEKTTGTKPGGTKDSDWCTLELKIDNLLYVQLTGLQISFTTA